MYQVLKKHQKSLLPTENIIGECFSGNYILKLHFDAGKTFSCIPALIVKAAVDKVFKALALPELVSMSVSFIQRVGIEHCMWFRDLTVFQKVLEFDGLSWLEKFCLLSLRC